MHGAWYGVGRGDGVLSIILSLEPSIYILGCMYPPMLYGFLLFPRVFLRGPVK